MSFKLPRRVEKTSNIYQGLPLFDWKDVVAGGFLGKGAFGKVVQGTYNVKKEVKQVVLKFLTDAANFEQEFAKEARLLDDIGKDDNKFIVKFIAVSPNPPTIMEELCLFEFRFFQNDRTTSNSLANFMKHVDICYNYEGFTHVTRFIIDSIISGISYLHSRNIVHRDLKPENILISNLEFQSCSVEQYLSQWVTNDPPVSVKITDFGESRSDFIQTLTLLKSKVDNFERGTPIYMAPELLIDELMPASAGICYLKKADLWALGMVIWFILNPDGKYPFKAEIEKHIQLNPSKASKKTEALKDLLLIQTAPSYSEKYFEFHYSLWDSYKELQAKLNAYDDNSRIKSIEELQQFKQTIEFVRVRKVFLNCSQSSAVESFDRKVASGIITPKNSIQNEATNSCSFLCLKIAECFSHIDSVSFEEMKTCTEEIIINLPAMVNEYRDISKLYDLAEAQQILCSNNLLSFQFELSEEIISESDIVLVADGDEFRSALFKILHNNAISIYICEPIIFLIYSYDESLCILDTHPISSDVGGNGNGLIVMFSSLSKLSMVTSAMCWMQKRLSLSVNKSPKQSLAILSHKEKVIGVGSLVEKEASCDAPKHGETFNKSKVSLPTAYDNKQSVEVVMNTSKPLTEKLPQNIEVSAGKFNPKVLNEPVNLCGDAKDSDPIVIFSSSSEEDDETSSSEHAIVSKLQYDVNCLSSTDEDKENNAGIYETNCSLGDTVASDKNKDTKTVQIKMVDADGSLYKGDPYTPVFAYGKDAFSWDEIASILLTKYDNDIYCIAPPIRVQDNVHFLVDTSKLKDPTDYKCDDMGAWRNYGVSRIPLESRIDPYSLLQRFSIVRTYHRNLSSTDLTKVSYMIEGSDKLDSHYVLLQYRFTGNAHKVTNIKPHGNSHQVNKSYRRTFKSVLKQLGNTHGEQPKKALDRIYIAAGDVTHARSAGELPRHPQQLYDARKRRNDVRTNSTESQDDPWQDKLWSFLQKARDSDGFNFIRDCRILKRNFYAVLASNQQLKDLEICCCGADRFSIMQFDPTFNIFSTDLSLTVSTFRNLKLVNRKTGKHPVFIGPMMIHQDKSWETYSNFAHSIVSGNRNLENLKACGTDGEKALIDGLRRNFRNSLVLQCFLHKKKNIERELVKRRIVGHSKECIMTDIFGKQEGTTKFMGLVDARSNDEFDDKLQHRQEHWNKWEGKDRNTFYMWFQKYQADIFKDSMLLPVRILAGLGDPAREYTNNDVEAANFMIKYSLKFEKTDPGKFIESVEDLIDHQYRDMKRAIADLGPFRLAEGYEDYSVGEDQYLNLLPVDREKKEKRFFDAPLKKDRVVIAQQRTKYACDFSSVRERITFIPKAILEGIISKAKILLMEKESIIKNPFSNGASFIVPKKPEGSVTITTDGDGLRCDKTCEDKKLKICSHILAVAFKEKTIPKLLNWYLKKRPPSCTDILVGPKKGMGKKPSQRKRSNKTKPAVTEAVDLFEKFVRHRPQSNTQDISRVSTFHHQQPRTNNRDVLQMATFQQSQLHQTQSSVKDVSFQGVLKSPTSQLLEQGHQTKPNTQHILQSPTFQQSRRHHSQSSTQGVLQLPGSQQTHCAPSRSNTQNVLQSPTSQPAQRHQAEFPRLDHYAQPVSQLPTSQPVRHEQSAQLHQPEFNAQQVVQLPASQPPQRQQSELDAQQVLQSPTFQPAQRYQPELDAQQALQPSPSQPAQCHQPEFYAQLPTSPTQQHHDVFVSPTSQTSQGFRLHSNATFHSPINKPFLPNTRQFYNTSNNQEMPCFLFPTYFQPPQTLQSPLNQQPFVFQTHSREPISPALQINSVNTTSEILSRMPVPVNSSVNTVASSSNSLTSISLSPIAAKNVVPPSAAVLDGFSIKFVAGTRVKKCYGCPKRIVNPPTSWIEQICVVHKDFREYRNRTTGLKEKSSSPQNVHFHPCVDCIKKRYKGFDSRSLIVPRQFLPLISQELSNYLKAEFQLDNQVFDLDY